MVKYSLDVETGDIVLEQAVPFLRSPGTHTISRDPQLNGQTYTGYDYNTGECSAPIDTPALSSGVKAGLTHETPARARELVCMECLGVLEKDASDLSP